MEKKIYKRWNKQQYSVFVDDFETFTENTTFYKRNNFSAVYCVSTKKVEISYNCSLKHYEIIKGKSRGSTKSYDPYIFVNLKDWIDFLRNREKDKYQIHYFHNFIKFDRHYLNAWLIDNNFLAVNNKLFQQIVNKETEIDSDCFTFEYSASKFALIKIYLKSSKGDKVLEFRDSRQLFKPSVEKLSKLLPTLQSLNSNIKTYEKVLDFDINEIQEPLTTTNELLNKHLTVYNRVKNDILVMNEIIKYYFTNHIFMPYGTNIKFSTPSIAMSHFYHLLIEKYNLNKKTALIDWLEITEDERKKINDYFLVLSKYYYGGITSFNKEHTNKWINEKIYSYDINSMYPAQMVKDLPFGKMKKQKSISKKDVQNKFIFCVLEGTRMKQLNKRIPALINSLWCKHSTDLEHFNYEVEKEVINFCVCLDEASIYLDKNNFESDLVVSAYLVFSKKKVLKDYVEKYYELKENATNKPERDLAKLLQNSLYGKFGEKPERKVDIPKSIFKEELVADKEGFILKNERANDYFKKGVYFEYAKNTYCPIASAITSLARSFLISTFLTLTKNDKELIIYYCDTDSMKVNKELEDKSLIDDKKLGLWKFEGCFNHLKIIRAKIYLAVNKVDEWSESDIFACAGFDSDKIKKYFTPNEINEDISIESKVIYYDLKHQPIISNSLKNLSKIH